VLRALVKLMQLCRPAFDVQWLQELHLAPVCTQAPARQGESRSTSDKGSALPAEVSDLATMAIHHSLITIHDHRSVGRGCGVGRGLGVALGVALGVGLTVAVAVGVAVGVGEGVGVGVGVGPAPGKG
jgi:hypothetical protein